MFWSKKKYKLGIVLGGGGARGFAHLGVLKALKEKGIEPDVISGVSAGSIAGAFIAAGKSPEEALSTISKYKFFDLTSIRFPRMGLFDLDGIQASIKKEIEVENLEDLKIPLIVAASNMLEGKIEYFSKGPIAKIVQASSAIPVLFNPVEINGKMYSDGGVFDNLPLKPIYEDCKYTIVVNISPVQPVNELKNIAQIATRMFQLGINAGRLEKMEKCTVFIEPEGLINYELLDTKHAREIFDAGYTYVKDLAIRI